MADAIASPPSGASGAPLATARRPTAGRRAAITVAVVLGVLVALNLLAQGIDHAVGREPSGVPGSSFGTQATGLAGAATLLAHFGHPVERQRGAVASGVLSASSTVFVIEPQTLTADDDAWLLEYVSEGGRLVIGATDPYYLRDLRDRPPVEGGSGKASYDRVDPSLGDVNRIATAGRASWTGPGSGTVLVRNGDAELLVEDHVGRGDLLFLADTSPLENAYLDQADNAAFALALAGSADRPVVFAEGTHGFGQSRGVGAIPGPWKLALVILAGAAVVLAWSRGRRFGPPDRPARELTPARAEYVRALAVSLERARDPAQALAPMRSWARMQVVARAHLPGDATDEHIDRAAIALGFSETERAALWYTPTDDDGVLALGRLVSHLSQREGRPS